MKSEKLLKQHIHKISAEKKKLNITYKEYRSYHLTFTPNAKLVSVKMWI